MANFIEQLSDQLASKEKQTELKRTLSDQALQHEESLKRLVKQNWHELPKVSAGTRHPAFAVDGSRAVRHLANGAYLFAAQALILGEGLEESNVDVRILPGSTDNAVVERFAGLMMHQLEVSLATQFAEKIAAGSVIFLDGALYGQLSSLYPIEEDAEKNPLPDYVTRLPEAIGTLYSNLFQLCNERQLVLISIAKTSHEVAHGEVWWNSSHPNLKMPREISDSEMIYRWTDKQTGCSTPILFGKRAFFRGSRRALIDLQNAPAIISFFIRLSEFDDALRIDVPASCVGRSETIDSIEQEQLIAVNEIAPILELLSADYGGLEVYNALLYSVDREVRLRQEMMDQVYHSMIENALGIPMPLDRSERRFHSR